MQLRVAWLLMAGVTLAAYAATGIEVPVRGAIAGADPAVLRPIVGIPGASLLGEPISLPEATASVVVAPGHGYALLGLDQDAAILALASRDPVRRLRGVRLGGAMTAFSSTGESLALYDAGQGSIEIWTGMPGRPRAAGKWDASRAEGIHTVAHGE
jgi:hypothetical protein